MHTTLLARSRLFLLGQRWPKLASRIRGQSSDESDEARYRWELSIATSISLVILLASLPWLFISGPIEAILAIFSALTGATAQLLRFYTRGTRGLGAHVSIDDEFIGALEALGAAGVGALIMLYLLV